MLYKITQILLFQGFFLLMYHLWLQKETFFKANRIYLLGTSVLSILLPFISINSLSNTIVNTNIIALNELILNSEPIQNQYITQSVSVGSLLFYVYILGVVFMLFRFSKNLQKLYILINNNKAEPIKGLGIVVKFDNSNKVFSFFNYIFIGKNNSENDYLLQHERVHAKHKHSLDLLWFELLKITMWFNPLVYFYQKKITELHEFIADIESLKSQDKNSYYNHILNDLFEVENMAFVNQFYHKSLIKKRITMMTQNKSQNWKQVKYLAVIPMLLLMLSITNTTFAQGETKKLEKEVVDQDVVTFSSIEEPPVFPGCEGTKEEAKMCFNTSVHQYVAKNFNADLAQTLGLDPGKKRINLQFTIDKKGNVTDIKSKAPHKRLEEEAIRVVNLLPKMKPGKQDGKEVCVQFFLPIVLEVKADKKKKK